MNLDFNYNNNNYQIEIVNPFYTISDNRFPSEFDYSIGSVSINGQTINTWSPDNDLEQHISDIVYDKLRVNGNE